MFEFIKRMFGRKKDMGENLELKELEVIISNHLNSNAYGSRL